MESEFAWKEEYTTRIEEIDTQHKHLLEVIKGIYELSDKDIDDTGLNILLEELVNTFQHHFTSEESLMEKYKYPLISEQRMQHELMKRNITRLVEETKHNRIILVQLLFNLVRWFRDHDNDYDKEFGKYILNIKSNSLE